VVSLITVVGPLIIGGPLVFGFVRVIQKRYQGQPAEIGDIFQGFQDFSKGLVTILLLFVCGIAVWIPLFIVNLILHFVPILGPLVAGLLTFATMLLVQAALFFVIQIAALSPVQPMDAIKQSIRFFVANLGPMILLALVTMVIAMAGVVACGVGIFFTVPLALIIEVVAYNEYFLPHAPPEAVR